ncbi:MAG: disulfide oxidoreductase [bacterium]|nr:disulfide oxidoreductase [bacterium]
MTTATIANFILSSFTLLGHAVIVALLFALLQSENKYSVCLLKFFNQNALLFAFIVAILSTGGSLFYSDVLGYDPCKLCWLQRIFMYPQVILLGLAWWKKDRGVAFYSIPLAIIGGLIALYHYFSQLGWLPAACAVVGYSVSCSQKFVLQFGYITIPLMAVTAFVLMILFLAIGKKTDSAN